ncbi:MAG TPA: class I SAM-dependent methyltransferase [Gemmatimonadaceae bacterium]|nr:class I SAM-dependent methyltransferase [Gemmatimonadaceae bacterium]
MRPNRPSRTAQFVALGRAIADAGLSHVPGFRDPTARVFLNARGTRSLARITGAARDGKTSTRVEMARGMADLMALRTTAIDAAVRESVAAGATQLVILGAGYDGRAWRMNELAGVRVFEVDRAATQADKRARVAELPPPIGDVRFVAIDFERESLAAVLERAGHDGSSPTCWICEGVVMYLTRDAMHATLADVAARSAPGSTLLVNYHTGHRRFFARLVYRLIGEPQISAWTPDEMAADLRAVEFVVREDSSMADWNLRFAEGKARVDRASYMRMAAATARPVRRE